MPIVGEIVTGKELQRKWPYRKFIWVACQQCGKERWRAVRHGVKHVHLCQSCIRKQQWQNPEFREHMLQMIRKTRLWGEQNPSWNGGRSKNAGGYVRVRLKKDDFFYAMCDKDNWVLEHRLIVAKNLNRCLLSWEVVHHKNGVRDDNRLQNLELIKGQHNHASFTLLQKENKWLKKLITQLEKKLGKGSSF